MFKIFKGSLLGLVLILLTGVGAHASEVLAPLLKVKYDYLQKMSMEDKPPVIDNIFSNSFEQVQNLSLGSAFFAAQRTAESLACDLTPDEILKIVAVSPYGDFIKDYFFQKGWTYEAISNDIPAICYKRAKCKNPEVWFDVRIIDPCQREVLNTFKVLNEVYKQQKNMALELKNKNIFSDGDLSNSPWDLLVDVQSISKILFKEPDEPSQASFVKKNPSFNFPSWWECDNMNLLGIVAFKLCWIESQYNPPSNGKTVLSIEEIVDELLSILEDAKRSGALMEHTKTDEWWETSLQGVKFKDIFSIDFVIDVKPLWQQKTPQQMEEIKQQQNQQIFQKALWWDGEVDTYFEKNKYNVLAPSTLEVVSIAKARSFNESTYWLNPWRKWLGRNVDFWTNMVGLFDLFNNYSNYFYQKLQSR